MLLWWDNRGKWRSWQVEVDWSEIEASVISQTVVVCDQKSVSLHSLFLICIIVRQEQSYQKKENSMYNLFLYSKGTSVITTSRTRNKVFCLGQQKHIFIWWAIKSKPWRLLKCFCCLWVNREWSWKKYDEESPVPVG